MTSSVVTFALVFVLTLALAIRVDACFSEGRRAILMANYKKRAQELGFKNSEIECLLQQGDLYQPKEYIVHGQVFKCYHDKDYSVHMVTSMSRCVDMNSVSVRTLANGDTQVVEPKVEPRVLRRPVEPSTPMRKVAHWLGLKETVRGECTCTSGCHYCCVNTSISGDDFCFRLHCRGVGYCS